MINYDLRERVLGVLSFFAGCVLLIDANPIPPAYMEFEMPIDILKVEWELPETYYYGLADRFVTWEPEPHELIRPVRALELSPNRDQLHCLALNIYHEARGSTLADQIGTALVVMNRVADDRYPDTICEVVYDHRQFSWTHDRITDYPHERNSWVTSQMVAIAVASGQVYDKTNGATHYHTTSISPFWTTSNNRQVIGSHVYMNAR